MKNFELKMHHEQAVTGVKLDDLKSYLKHSDFISVDETKDGTFRIVGMKKSGDMVFASTPEKKDTILSFCNNAVKKEIPELADFIISSANGCYE